MMSRLPRLPAHATPRATPFAAARAGLALPGLMTLPIRTPLPHVLLTGGLNFAGLGFEGEVLSGMKAGFLAAGDVEP